VIGASGVLGGLTVTAFERAGWRVLRGGRTPQRHPDARIVDLADAESQLLLAEADVVVNTACDPQLAAELAVLEHGGLLLNVTTQAYVDVRSRTAAVTDPKGTVVMNVGIAPGVTNLVAADLLSAHPDADELEFVFTVSALSTSGNMGADFVHRGLTASARHPTLELPLPEPFGVRECIGFAEGERAWLGALGERVTVRPHLALAEPEAHAGFLQLNADGGLAELPRELFGTGRPPTTDGPSREPVAHWIAVLEGGRRLEARTVECRGDYVAAAHATMLMAEALAVTGPPPGLASIEDVLTLTALAPSLFECGVEVVHRSLPAVAGA